MKIAASTMRARAGTTATTARVSADGGVGRGGKSGGRGARMRVSRVFSGASSSASASSLANSPADPGRSSGSSAIPRCSTRATLFGAAGQTSFRSGAPSVAIWCAISTGVRPSRGRLPLSASKLIAASAYTSAAGPAPRPSSCSGAMYPAVPSTVPLRVILVPSDAVAIPRSASFVTPSSRTSTLPGFTSRCTTPCECA